MQKSKKKCIHSTVCWKVLSYTKCSLPGSNWRPLDYETNALPTEPRKLRGYEKKEKIIDIYNYVLPSRNRSTNASFCSLFCWAWCECGLLAQVTLATSQRSGHAGAMFANYTRHMKKTAVSWRQQKVKMEEAQKKGKKTWTKTQKRGAAPGIEPGTTRTLSEYHTPRPSGRTKCEELSMYGQDWSLETKATKLIYECHTHVEPVNLCGHLFCLRSNNHPDIVGMVLSSLPNSLEVCILQHNNNKTPISHHTTYKPRSYRGHHSKRRLQS